MTRVSVVTLARGRHDHLAAQHRSLARQDRVPDDYHVVAMGDADIRPEVVEGLGRHVLPVGAADRLPLARARNRGVAAALAAGSEVVVCLDVDCLAAPGLVAAYVEAVGDRPDVVWSGPVTYLGAEDSDLARRRPSALAALDDPHPARPAPAPGGRETGADPRLFWSLSFAVSASAWARTGGFCEDYTGYGGEDTDFGRRAASCGLDLGWVGSARAYHQHHPTQDPPVQHLDDILRNGALFHRRWGEWPMAGWLEAFEALGLVRRRGDGWERVLDPPG